MVLVVIKAANGAVDDFRVNGAESGWTVSELKNYLYRHYPTHPPVPSQKLIYRGQLLTNTQQLSDIVSDSEKVVIHLVAYERSASAPALRSGVTHSSPRGSSSSGDVSNQGEGREEGEREATAPTVSPDTSTGGGRQPQSVAAGPPGHTPHPGLRYRPHPQHMQWFPGGPAPLAFPAGGAAYPYPPFYMAPPYAPGGGVGPAYQLQQWYQAYYGRPGGVGGAGGEVGGGGGGGGGEEIDLPNLPDQPEGPDLEQDDLPMNAGAAGGMMLAGPQIQARRDLVDYGYMLLMATVLVSIAFFTSSFGRIILFLSGVLFMFLNQAGFFSLRRRPRNAGAGRGVDDLPDPLDRHRARQEEREGGGGGEGEGTEQAGAGEPEAGDGGEDTTDGAGSNSAPAAPPTPPRPGVLTVAFTFITTLFTSLLPQQQPEL